MRTRTVLFGAAATVVAAGAVVGHLLAVRPAEHALVVQGPRSSIRHSVPPPPRYQFPSGGRTLTGAYRFVALYGSPDSPSLGALGEQPLPAAITRAQATAEPYRALSGKPVLPTFEIIATIASASPTANGDYSRELDPAQLRPWVEQARDAGVYVVLDLQPGRSDFLMQAKQYEQLLKEPNVGLALDPEWRLGPREVPLKQIGSVQSAEVNGVADWLAAVTRNNNLPQKLFVLHQFRLDMLPDRGSIAMDHIELTYIIQMDGQGTQPAKQDTWRAVTQDAPPAAEFGWKNFYHQDGPMLDPAGTMQVSPQPWYISYQ